jgi:hypothetical protein
MTWLKLEPSFGFGVSESFSGLNYPVRDGVALGQVSLVAGLIGGAAILLAQLPGFRWLALVGGGAGAVAGLVAWSFRGQVEGDSPSDLIDVARDLLTGIQVGPGINVVLGGSVAIVAASFVTLVSRRRSVTTVFVTAPGAMPVRALEPTPNVPPPALTPGWMRDPTGRFELRYWDGRTWTGDVATDGRMATDALAGPPDPRPWLPPTTTP